MLTIACLSQKGGCGKSTLSRLIARTYAQADWRVKIADFNTKQKTSVDWVALRLHQKIEPVIQAEPFTSVKTALKQSNFDLMVFDGKPDSEPSTLDLAKEANLVVIPAVPTQDDLIPNIKFAHELRARAVHQPKIFFVINKTTESQVWADAARAYIQEAGYSVARTELPYKTGYQTAQNTGRAVSETNYPSLNEKADALAAEIVERLTQLTGN